MRRQGAKSNGNDAKSPTGISSPPSAGELSDAALFLQSMQDPEIIERVRTTITNAHVFKLPPRQSASVGWRGADWKEKVWQGTVKVVERGDLTAVLLVDRTKGSIFAVCPVKEGAVDRCVDSSRYFVLRIENANGRHMFIGVAFNERNDAFDFNTALEDSRREREMEQTAVPVYTGPPKDYSIKEGEKIKVSIPKTGFGKYHGRSTARQEGNVTQVWKV
jgi:adaptin ear-binding coat-associated protein 1/2